MFGCRATIRRNKTPHFWQTARLRLEKLKELIKPCLLLELNKCTLSHVISSMRKWMDNHEIEEIFFTGSKPIAAPNIHEEIIKIIEGICQVEREYEKSLGFQEEDDPAKF